MKWILYEGNCFDYFDKIGDKSIDMVLCDPPYGTTSCKWDTPLPLDELWIEYKRIIKDNGAIVLTAIQPFTSTLVSSNYDMFKYSLVWNKSKVCHFAQAPYRFLTEHEDVLVFSRGGTSKNAKIRMKYNPQGTIECNKVCKGKGHSDHRPSKKVQSNYLQTRTNYPKSILKFKSDTAKFHPTEKPVALFEYLIKTYTNEGDLVLDNCAGSGTTGVACQNLNRDCIMIEKELDYCEVIKRRMKENGENKNDCSENESNMG